MKLILRLTNWEKSAQINGYIATVKDTVVNQMKKMTKSTLENLDKIESSLMQPKAKAPQDVLAFNSIER
jgi:hypothetical protein